MVGCRMNGIGKATQDVLAIGVGSQWALILRWALDEWENHNKTMRTELTQVVRFPSRASKSWKSQRGKEKGDRERATRVPTWM